MCRLIEPSGSVNSYVRTAKQLCYRVLPSRVEPFNVLAGNVLSIRGAPSKRLVWRRDDAFNGT